MAFDWREFFKLAHEMRNEPLESKRRTSIGRAYYYAFNIALIEAQRRGYNPRMPLLSSINGGLHKKLWAWYSFQTNLEDRQVGINGNKLHSRRIKVDYDGTPSPSLSLVRQQLDETRDFELLLATVASRLPPPPLP